MPKFIVRLDDICPTMDWTKFRMFRDRVDAVGVRPLIGVIPDNRDPSLMVDPPEPDFWDQIRRLEETGWCISQHGYTHVYSTKNGGILNLNQASEFAGIPLEQQAKMLSSGREILARERLATDVFMAPSHSYDRNTLKALVQSGFKCVTDGYGLWPYIEDSLIFVPQLFASPKTYGEGIYTICLHLNPMSEAAILNFLDYVDANRADFIRFRDAREKVRTDFVARLSRPLTRVTTKLARQIRRVAN